MTKKNPKPIKDLQVRRTADELLELRKTLAPNGSPESVRNKFEDMFKHKEDEVCAQDKESQLLLLQAASIHNMDNQILVANTTSQEFVTFVLQFSRDLIAEYGCKSPSEKILAQTIAEAYGRVLKLAKYLNMNLDRESYNDLTILRQKAVSMDIDRAHRQYLTALQLLQQMKSPQLHINLKATNAFVATNQQNIASNSTPNDNIDKQ